MFAVKDEYRGLFPLRNIGYCILDSHVIAASLGRHDIIVMAHVGFQGWHSIADSVGKEICDDVCSINAIVGIVTPPLRYACYLSRLQPHVELARPYDTVVLFHVMAYGSGVDEWRAGLLCHNPRYSRIVSIEGVVCRHEIESVHLLIAILNIAQRLIISLRSLRAGKRVALGALSFTCVEEQTPLDTVEEDRYTTPLPCLIDISRQVIIERGAWLCESFCLAWLVMFLIVMPELYEDIVSRLYPLQYFLTFLI